MPTVAIVDGILILVYRNDHAPPHFHVRQAGKKGRFEIATGRLMDGRLDRRTIGKVQQWNARNQDLLMAAWDQAQSAGQTWDNEIVTVGEPWADVVSVRVAGPLTLFVEHDDGVSGEVRFEESHLRGVFEKLRDPAFFARVGILHGAVSWPNEEVDLAPDNMHRHLKRDGEWILN